MPRNSSGQYTLPAANPVVTGTTITSSWANLTMSDIASEITNSLDRQGRGGMIAPFKVSDGSVAAPGIAFNNEPSTGWYRPSTGQIGISILGTNVAMLGASGASIVGNLTVGGTSIFTGAASWAGAPTDPAHLANKSYVDGAIGSAAYLPLTGGNITGNLGVALNFGVAGASTFTGTTTFTGAPSWSGIPATPQHLTTKAYVDAAVSGVPINSFLPLTGGTLAGPGNLQVNGLLGVGPAAVFNAGVSAQFNRAGSNAVQIQSDGSTRLSFYVDAGTSVIGGQNNLDFYTNDVRRLRINSAGYFYEGNTEGLGIAGPFKHQIEGSFLTYGDAMGYRALNASNNAGISMTVSAGAGAGGSVDSEGGPLRFGAGGAERGRFAADGNFGVGTTSFGYAVGGRTIVAVGGANSGFLELQSAGVNRGYIAGSVNGIEVGVNTGYFDVVTGGVERVRVDSQGNVGIGQVPSNGYGRLQPLASAAALPNTNSNLPAGFSYAAFSSANGASPEWVILGGQYNAPNHGAGIVLQDTFQDNGQYGGRFIQAASQHLVFGVLTNGTLGSTNATPVGQIFIDPSGNTMLNTTLAMSRFTVARNVFSPAPGPNPSIVLSNRDMSNAGGVAAFSGGLFQDSYRDVVPTQHFTAGVWFERVNNGGVTTTGNVVFGASGSNNQNQVPTERARIDGTTGVFTYGGFEIGFRDAPITGVGAGYTITAADRGRAVRMDGGGVNVQPLSEGGIVTIYNNTGAAQTITPVGMTNFRLAGTTLTGARTIAANGLATIYYYAGTGNAVISGAGVS